MTPFFLIFALIVAILPIVSSATADAKNDLVMKELWEIFGQGLKTPDLQNPSQVVPEDPEVGLDMVALVQSRGYQIETHHVTTTDGYILTMFNIPYGKNSNTRNKYPVILQHGLLDSSYTWIANFEDESLGYLLADAGFDVWFGNNRGNRYGRNHTYLNPDDGSATFWDFSWDQMALYDVPALINYVTNTTGSPRVSWVGHSEGTIQMFAAGTVTEKYPLVKDALSKLDLFVALAPVAYVHNIKSKELVLLAHSKLVERLMRQGIYEFLPYGPLNQIAPTICRLAPEVCHVILRTICGPTQNLNDSRLQVYVSNTPAGTSTVNMDHWLQGVQREKFQMYDYGDRQSNNQHYGQPDPPAYELKKFVPKVALFIGSNDFLADPRDVKQLIDELPSEKIVFQDTQVSRLSSFLCVLLDGRRPCSRTTSRTSTSPGRSMRTLASTTKSRIY
jgi:lysosomal acid lipase/cholesteryl ester hydrolase